MISHSYLLSAQKRALRLPSRNTPNYGWIILGGEKRKDYAKVRIMTNLSTNKVL